MRQRTKILTMVTISMFLLVSVASVVSHDRDEGKGTLGATSDFESEGYIPVSSVSDLGKVGRGNTSASSFDNKDYDWELGDKYYLTNDIIMPDILENHIPIGNEYNPFTGIFDGNGKKIIGLNVATHDTGSQAVGLFAYASGAAIRNLTIKGGSFSVSSDVEGIAGSILAHVPYEAKEVTIENCRNEGGSVSAEASLRIAEAGGIVGKTQGVLTVKDCYNSSSVTSSGGYVSAGGIIGNGESHAAQIIAENCTNDGPITASGDSASASGIIGSGRSYMENVIAENCTNDGPITASGDYAYAAGIIACYMDGKNLEIRNCHNKQSLTALASSYVASAGGMTAYVEGSVTIEGCSNTAEVTVSSASEIIARAGGIAGEIFGPLTMKDCYNTGSVSAVTSGWRAYAGGVVGHFLNYKLTAVITNCYSSGIIIADSNEACAAGIIGYTYDSTITNCYFLEGSVSPGPDILFNGNATVDGNADGTPREGPQGSGAKSKEELMPSIGKVLSGDSIFFIGDPDGWDFIEIWTIDPEKNGGYPIFGKTYLPEGPGDQGASGPELSAERQECIILMVCLISLTTIALGYFIFLRNERRGEE
jgi:hypothetical protein